MRAEKRWRCPTEVVLDSTWSTCSFGASKPRNADLLRAGQHSESAPPIRVTPDEWGASTMRNRTHARQWGCLGEREFERC